MKALQIELNIVQQKASGYNLALITQNNEKMKTLNIKKIILQIYVYAH